MPNRNLSRGENPSAPLALPGPPEIEVRLLGGFEVTRGGAPVDGFESAKARAVLAYLALTRAVPTTRERLAGLFWPEQEEERARRNLRQVIYNLRGALGDRAGQILAARTHEVRLVARGVWVDAEEFAAAAQPALAAGDAAGLAAAVALYRGELLHGLFVKQSDLFEEWLQGERERLRELAGRALARLAALREERGETEAGISAARRLLEIEPLSEAGHRRLMRLFARSGRRTRALAVFEELRRRLDEELGVAPAAATVELRRQLLAEAEAGPAAAAGAPVEAPGPALPLAGRAEALAALAASWAEARRGGARLALVEGPAGSGKTRLARTALHAASSGGALVLTGRAADPLAGGTFGPLLEAVAGLPAERLADAPAPAKQALAELVARSPELGLLRPDFPRLRSEEAGERGIAEAVAALLAALSSGGRPGEPRRAIALFLDDLDLAAPPLAHALEELCRELGEAPVWLLGAARTEPAGSTEEEDAEAPATLRLERADRVATGALDGADLAEVARAVAGGAEAEALAAALARSTGGLPAAVAEAVNLLADEGHLPRGGAPATAPAESRSLPEGLEKVLLRRVARLPTSSRRFLTLAAVAGVRFEVELLAAADGEREIVAEAAVEVLVQHWLVRPVVGRWFDGARERDTALWAGGTRRGMFELSLRALRDLLYRRLDPARQREMHRQLAAAMEARDGLRPGPIAQHWLLGGEWARALPWLERAAERAALAGDGFAAERHRRRLEWTAERIEMR